MKAATVINAKRLSMQYFEETMRETGKLAVICVEEDSFAGPFAER
ncbi:MAG: hypothetical protein ACKVHR_08860 [Pirellulales bacterium]|jgi:hypothetical protein